MEDCFRVYFSRLRVLGLLGVYYRNNNNGVDIGDPSQIKRSKTLKNRISNLQAADKYTSQPGEGSNVVYGVGDDNPTAVRAGHGNGM
jgi:hypothetical protein